MSEKYDLKQLLREIHEDEGTAFDLDELKTPHASQDDIGKLFKAQRKRKKERHD